VPPWPFDPDGHRLSMAGVKTGDGGIILVWVNHHFLIASASDTLYPPGIWCQKLNPNNGNFEWYRGTPPYSAESAHIYISPSTYPPSICESDQNGGCVIAYLERSDYNYKVKVKKLNINGVTPFPWPDTGLTLDYVNNVDLPHSILGNPKVVKAGDNVIVVWQKIKEIYKQSNSSTNDPISDDKTTLYAMRISLSDGSKGSPIPLLQKSNDDCYWSSKDSAYVWWWYWNVLDFNLAVDNANNLFVAERIVRHRRRYSLICYYHGDSLEIRVQKLPSGSTTPQDKRLDSFYFTAGGYIMAIDNMPLRSPVLTPTYTGGVIVAYPWGEDGPQDKGRSDKVEDYLQYTTDWSIKLKYLNSSLNVTHDIKLGSLGGNSLHMPDIIPESNGCILAYSAHNNPDFSGSRTAYMRVKRFDQDGSELWSWSTTNASYPRSHPRIIKSDNNHCIVVWDEQNGSTDWDIKAIRLNINTGEVE